MLHSSFQVTGALSDMLLTITAIVPLWAAEGNVPAPLPHPTKLVSVN